MDSIVSGSARLLAEASRHTLLAEFPAVLLDIGCSDGINSIWSHLGANLIAHGYDTNGRECERLRGIETRRRVHYHERHVGLPEGHPFLAGRAAAEAARGLEDAFARTSAAAALACSTPDGIRRNDYGQLEPRNPMACSTVDELVGEEKLAYTDVLKIDVDGDDLAVLHSAASMLRTQRTGCAVIEVCFEGSADPYSNTYSNLDLFLRERGFRLAALSIWRYSQLDLPSPFKYRAIGETVLGTPLLGDAAYFRVPQFDQAGGSRQDAAEILKLAALYEIFGAPDRAARLLRENETLLARSGVDCARLLDLLASAIMPGKTYQEYLNLFRNDVGAFFPVPP